MKRLLTVCIAIVVALAASCGSGLDSRADYDQLALDDALEQLDQLAAPAGSNPQLFSELKSTLAAALRTSGVSKFTSDAPSGSMGEVTDLALTASGGFSLEWTYRNKGDYDQNRQVTISDLSALGANLGKTSSSPDWLTKAIAADGDSNGEVNISDITPIGAGLLNTVTGYKIQTSDTPGNEPSWQDFDEVTFETSSIPGGSALRRFSHNFAPGPGSWYRVVPVDGESRGKASNSVQYALSAPAVSSVTPVTGLAGSAVSFSSIRTGGTPTSWSWDFGGGATPNASTQVSPSVTLGAEGSYNTSLTVSNPAGSDIFNFTLDVTNPPAPVIDDVQPQSGSEGTQVSFGATLSGGPVATYAWDFGGGATPNTDTAAAPFVTLGSAGIYPANLTVSNAGGSDTFNFNLTITLIINNPPTASFTATPQNGNPGDPVQLDASASSDSDGTITKYEWDLDGDGTFELDGGTDPMTNTSLPNPAGSVDVSLRVTDDGGAQDEAARTLSSLTQGWRVTTVHSPSNGIAAPPYLAEINGLPGIAFAEYNIAGQKFITFAYTDTDDATNGWNMMTADNAPPAAMSLAEINKSPAIAFIDDTDSSLRFAYTSSSDGSSDWKSVSVDGSINLGLSASLADINGKPAIAYHDTTDSELLYAHSTTDDGSSGWNIVSVDATNSLGGSLALIDGKPAIAYTTAGSPDSTELRYAYSSSGDGSADWASLTIPETAGAWFPKVSLSPVDGFPAILWGSLSTKQIYFSHSTVADGSSGWATLETNMGATVSCIFPQSLAFEGYPYSALISTSDQVSVGINGSTDGTAKWSETVVDADTAEGVTLALINGNPAVAYKLLGTEVRYAIYK